jgi:ankyrin repeat protein
VDANAPDKSGDTPLQRVVEGGNLELAKHILDAGGFVNVKKIVGGRMQIHIAVITPHYNFPK